MSSLQNKMYNYEAHPPVSAWDKIAAALDEAELSSRFPATLQQMEVAPPATAWDKINAALQTTDEEDQKVVPMQKRIRGFVRYAAAAIFIGALAFGVYRMSTGSETNETAAAETNSTAADTNAKALNPTIPQQVTTDKSVTGQTATNTVPESRTAVLAKNDRVVRANRNTDAYSARSSSRAASIGRQASGDYSNAIYTYNDHIPTVAERYITLLTPDGGFIRMAKKWSNLLCCVSGQDQDADCKDQLKKWQEKIASSPIAPAPGNFMDLLDLVNSLNDDTQL